MFQNFGLSIAWLDLAVEFLKEMVLYLAFFVGIMLMVSKQSVERLNQDFQKEAGIRKRIWPQLENKASFAIDRILLKHSFWTGLFIAITSFSFLLADKIS